MGYLKLLLGTKLLEEDSKTMQQLGISKDALINIGGRLLGGGFPGLGKLWHGESRVDLAQSNCFSFVIKVDLFLYAFPFQYDAEEIIVIIDVIFCFINQSWEAKKLLWMVIGSSTLT